MECVEGTILEETATIATSGRKEGGSLYETGIAFKLTQGNYSDL